MRYRSDCQKITAQRLTALLWRHIYAGLSNRESDCDFQHVFCVPGSGTGVKYRVAPRTWLSCCGARRLGGWLLNPNAILRKGNRKSSSQKRTAFRIAPLPDTQSGNSGTSITGKTVGAIRMASDDFLETAFYFTIGAAIAATFNTAVDQQLILPLASHTTLSIMAMMALSGILTLCSTSDAFIAATFVTFPMVARLAFLVFGPMFDLKLFFLYSVLFRKRFVIALGVGLFLLVGLLCGCIIVHIYASQGF